MSQSFFIKTYGCQMNEYDSEKLNDLLEYNGYKASKILKNLILQFLILVILEKKRQRSCIQIWGGFQNLKRIKRRLGKKCKLLLQVA